MSTLPTGLVEDLIQTSAPRLAGLAIGEAGAAARSEYLSLSSALFHVPDTTVDGTTSGRLELRAAAVRGLSHRAHNESRQDAYAFTIAEPWWVIAVADGVGSTREAQLAAHLSVDEAVARASTALAEAGRIDWQEIFDGVSEAISELRGELGMATTLTVAAGNMDTDPWELRVGSLGDSRALILSAGTWSEVAEPDSSEGLIVSTATDALPARDGARVRSAIACLGSGEALALFTDGIGAPFGTGNGVVAAQLADWWQSPADALSFAAQVGFMRRGFHDDRAAVVVWNRAKSVPTDATAEDAGSDDNCDSDPSVPG